VVPITKTTWRTLYTNITDIRKDVEAPQAFAKVFQFDDGSYESELTKELEQVCCSANPPFSGLCNKSSALLNRKGLYRS
jgi:hypothetical protein